MMSAETASNNWGHLWKGFGTQCGSTVPRYQREMRQEEVHGSFSLTGIQAAERGCTLKVLYCEDWVGINRVCVSGLVLKT